MFDKKYSKQHSRVSNVRFRKLEGPLINHFAIIHRLIQHGAVVVVAGV